ncbi:MAG: hypothetical protein JRM78_04230 [Nitrososphaerota archaeon]|jgi:hypothetical protein|nr:hypothetical protein [Nitrososphaerota archaeon]
MRVKAGQRKEAAIVLMIILAGLFLWANFAQQAAPAFKVYGVTNLKYSDGSTWSSNSSVLAASVVQNNGKTINAISEDVYGTWSVSGAASSARVQYFVYYYVNITGPFYYGGRIYTSLTGYTDLPLTSYPTMTVTTNPWLAIENGINPTDSWLTDWYYQAGSGAQIGPYNTGGVLAAVVTNPRVLNANQTNSVTSSFESLLGVSNITNGKTSQLTSWSMTGVQLFNNMMQTSWGGPLGLEVGVGGVSIGNGYFASMATGSQYKLTFIVSYLYRWQDATGQWTPWHAGTANLGSLALSLNNGYYVQVYFTASQSQSVT